VTGFVEPDEEAMAQRLQRIASGRQRFDRRRCRAVAIARFGADRMVDRYEALYHAALGQPAWAVEAR
jgi:glycosyltransferase involved in cell wall biosynthesis